MLYIGVTWGSEIHYETICHDGKLLNVECSQDVLKGLPWKKYLQKLDSYYPGILLKQFVCGVSLKQVSHTLYMHANMNISL